MSIYNHIGTNDVVVGGIDVISGCAAIAVKPNSINWGHTGGWIGIIEGNIFCTDIRNSSKEALSDANKMLNKINVVG